MKNMIGQWLMFLTVVLTFLAPRQTFGAGACTCARFNDFYDCGCRKTRGSSGGPASGSAKAGGNNAYCPTCQKTAPSLTGPDEANPDISALGMPRWWIDEPYINVHVTDVPLSYTTSSGQEMTFRFNYKQRFSVPGLDQIPSQIVSPTIISPNPNRIADDNYVNNMHQAATSVGSVNSAGMTNAAWSHNWMMHIVIWDWTWEQALGAELYPFQFRYEAFLFDSDGGIRYLSDAGIGGAIDGETLNPPTQTNDPISQVQLSLKNPVNFTNVPTPDGNGIYWGSATNALIVAYPDGSQDVFGLLKGFPLGYTTTDALLTQRIDPQGRMTQLGYQAVTITNSTLDSEANLCFRLRYVVDTDNRTNTFTYASSTANPWLVNEIDDPFGRKATFAYNASNWLSTIIDAANNTNSFAYTNSPSPSGWLKSLTTPYGTTSFSYYQLMDSFNTSNFVERVALVSEPGGANQLFAYVHNLIGLVEASNNSPAVPGVVFDDGRTFGTDPELYHRNSFHWDRKQFANLSGTPRTTGPLTNYLGQSDFQKASMQHWLMGADTNSITETLSSTRDPSPDPGGATLGARTWLGYTDTTTNTHIEVTGYPIAAAQFLPDGSSNYTIYNYYKAGPQFGSPSIGLVSSNSKTYTKPDGTVGLLTNYFHYTNNNIDLYSVSNSIGQSNNLAYNSHHQGISFTDALNQVSTNGYDSTSHNLTNVLFSSGRTVGLVYYSPAAATNDAYFLNTVTVQPEGLTKTITDYTSGLPHGVQISGTGLNTLSVSNTWDALNRLTGTLFPDGTTTSNVYTNLDLAVHTDRLGHTTHFVYDQLEHLHYITNALTNLTTLTWCSCGSLTGITDPLGNPTALNYDNQERLTNVAFPDGSSFTNQFDFLGRLTNRIDGAGKSVAFTYNNQGLITAIGNGYGQIFGAAYDAVGNALTVTNADGVFVTSTYDLLNRVINNAWPDGSTEQFQYSTNGLITYTNQDKQITHFGRDGAGRLVAITNNLSQTNGFGYDALDHVTSLADGLGHNTFWNYNQYGWLTNKLNNLNASVLTNGYDANGQMTTRWMPATGITTYKWDADGNLTNTTYPNRTNTYIHDSDDRLTGITDANGADTLTSSFTYTQIGQLSSETGPWTSNTLTYTYNQGHRAALSLNSQIPTINQSYGYDSAWRLQSLASLAGTFTYGYTANSPSSLVRTVGLPNAAVITNHYDTLARLDYTALLNYWNHPLDGYAYILDSWGLRTNITRQLGLSTNVVTNAFDGIGQITFWSGRETNGTLRQNEQLGYAYDAAGNLNYRTNGALIQTFADDTLNQISSVTRSGTFTVAGALPAPAVSVTVNGAAAQTNGDFTFASTGNSLANGNNTFTIIAQNLHGTNTTNIITVNLPTPVNFQYDANGNLTNDGTRWFYYDAENQLTNITVAAQWQVVFVFDGLNRRRIERDYTWTGAWSLTNETHYLYDGMLIVQERDTTNNPLVTYIRGLDLSMSLSGAGGIGGMLARTDVNGPAFYHADGNGNITALMDGNQNIVARYEYDGFGRLIGKWGSMADANHYRFSSKEYDMVAGLYYYGHRFYEPNFQRFLNRDPLGEAGGINLYQAMGNDAVNYFDPYGDSWYNPWSWGLGSGLGNWLYSPGAAQAQGVMALNAQLAANNTTLPQFKVDNPTWNGDGSLTAGNMQAAQGAANLGGAAMNGEIDLYGAILPGGIAAKEGEEAAAAARAASTECPKYPKIGYKGTKPYRDAMKAIQNGGTHVNLGFVPTEAQARQLLEDAGVDLSKIRVEDPHLPPNPHDYPHINYPTPGGGKGTIPIQ